MKKSKFNLSSSQSTRRIYCPAWLSGLILAAVLTFVLAFYLPATQTNAKHSQQFTELADEYARAVQIHRATTEKLSQVEAVREEQKRELDEIARAKASSQKTTASLYTKLTTSLSKEIKAKVVSVEEGQKSVRVSIEGMFLIYPHQIFVHARGQRLLCKVAKAVAQNEARLTEVLAHANGSKPASAPLEKQFPTSWQLSGVLAADVAEKLQTCGMQGTELRSVGAAHHQGNAGLAKKSPARFDIVVYPKATDE